MKFRLVAPRATVAVLAALLLLASPSLAGAAPAPQNKQASEQPGAARAANGLINFPDFRRREEGSLGEPLRWNPRWPRFGLTGWIVGGLFGATSLAMALVGPVGSDPWRGGIGPDESVRDALGGGTEERRRRARDISDVLLSTTVTYSLVDALLVAGWFRRSPDVATQMALIDVEVFAVTQGIISVLKSAANRERPYGRYCGTERPEQTRDCADRTRFYSFPSGHTGHTFAAAASNCTHHIYLGLYGRTWADALSCVAGFSLATATGWMRIAGDQHYFSDVMIGAGVGTLVGFGVPWLFHYRHGARTTPGRDHGPSVKLLPYPLGAMAVGQF